MIKQLTQGCTALSSSCLFTINSICKEENEWMNKNKNFLKVNEWRIT